MRKIFTIIITVIITSAIWAQPLKMSYQAVIRNSSNVLVTSTTVGMRISILQGSPTGTPFYVETQTPTTNANGLVSIEIGGGTPVTGTFANIDWSVGTYFIKTETDPTGGINYTITGTSQLLSVPYALYSLKAANGFSGNYIDLTGKPSFATVATSGNFNDLLNKPNYSSKISDLDGNTNIMVEKNPNEDTLRITIAGKERIKFDGKTLFWLNEESNIFLGNNSGTKTIKGVDIDEGSITGFNNSFFGDYSGEENTTGYRNTFIGSNTGLTNSTGFRNTIVGSIAGQTSYGSYNVFVGASSGWANGDGEKNVYIGSQSGAYSGGSGNIFIGQKSGWIETGSNKLYISNSETSEPLIYGEFDNSLVTINGSLKATNGINANNKLITNVSTPINSTDATNKAYVDALFDQIKQLQAEIGATDIDGNHYNSEKIGTQVWMAENLKAITYNDGTEIPLVTGNTEWAALSSPAYCWYNNDISNQTVYGALYNWYTVNTGKLCPKGWHVPTHAEWTTLTDYLTNNGYGYGGSGIDIAKSMAAKSGWDSNLTEGTIGNDQASNNSSGFSAKPGGVRGITGIFDRLGQYAYFWSATGDATDAWIRHLLSSNYAVYVYGEKEKKWFFCSLHKGLIAVRVAYFIGIWVLEIT